jgi:hypothetical protein
VQIEIHENHCHWGGVRWGHNWEKTFLHKLILEKFFFSKTSRPISIKLDASYACMKGIEVSIDKGTNPHQRGDNHKKANIGWGHLKILFSRTNDPGELRFT